MKRATLLTAIWLLLLTACMAWGGEDPLRQDFLSPPADSRPGCYWYWLNGNVSKEGITRDLEAMARVGIGRAYIGHIHYHNGPGDTPVGEVTIFSEKWWEAVQWAVKEADRCGVEIGFFNSPGWSQSGGPWVEVSQSMRSLRASETVIEGGEAVDVVLPVPRNPSFIGREESLPFDPHAFQDVRVLALRQPQAEHADLDMKRVKASCDSIAELGKLTDGVGDTTVRLQGTHVIDFHFEQPQAMQSLVLDSKQGNGTVECTVEAVSADGSTRKLAERSERRSPPDPLLEDPFLIPFAPTTTAHLRVTLKLPKPVELSGLRLSRRAVLSHHVDRQLRQTHPSIKPPWDGYHWPQQDEVAPGSAVDPAGVIDLSDKMDAQGRLRWNAPDGRWVVMRIGMMTTGAMCGPAGPVGRGLEIDKMSKRHVRSHFDGMMGEFLRRTPAAERKALKYVIADSYETGPQNWTDDMLAKFEQRFGYSPVPYLPCISGRVVGSAEISTRFLWDWRRLIAESIADDYVGGLREVANEHGLKLWLENYGHFGFPSEFLRYGSRSDQMGGEFWEPKDPRANIEVRSAASAAHTYGRQEVYVEAFTSVRHFKRSPGELKALNDWVLAAGANHLILHVYTHQPDERPPGTVGWGTDFNRHNTWFEPSKAFLDYNRRASVLLKAGRPVVDVAYYIGEDAPVMTGPLDPALPDGFDYDHINAEVLIHHATVEDGRICIENGPRYAVLVLPNQDHMTPQVAVAIRRLVEQGATILGSPPTRSPSLAGFPDCDEEVARITTPMWSRAADATASCIRFGKGRVFRGVGLEEVFKEIGLAPDISIHGDEKLLCAAAGAGVIGRGPHGGIVFKHRRTEERDIYFVANTSDRDAEFMAAFRVSGRQPWLWDADTGRIEKARAFSQQDGLTRVPLRLESSQSVFAVFEGEVAGDAKGPAASNHRDFQNFKQLAGPWQVSFRGLGAPELTEFPTLTDWAKHPDPAIRGFSGTATYRMEFEFAPADLGKPTRLHLGEVGVIATVTLNGEQVGTVWTTPWAIDITKQLKAGRNQLAIEVTNNWNNRLAADAGLEPVKRLSHLSKGCGFHAKSPLQASGLIGPVWIGQAERLEPRHRTSR